jgi:TolA-binding protein
MKKRYLTPLLLLGLIPLISSCASQQEVQTLSYHVRSINKKLDDMKVNTVGQMQQRQADSSGTLDQIQTELLVLKGKLEENSHMNRMLQEQNKELQLAVQTLTSQQDEKMNQTISNLNAKIALQNESLVAIQTARVLDAERRSRAAAKAADDAMKKAQAAKRTRIETPVTSSGSIHIRPLNRKVIIKQKKAQVAPSQTVIAPLVVENPATTPKPAPKETVAPKKAAPVLDSYSKGQQKFRDGDFKSAYTLFEKSTSKGDTNTAIRSRYMMGECLYKQGSYDQAIIQYQQIISNYPGNPQAAKALLRQGESFEQLSDKETAKIIYQKLMRSYSTSPESATAQQRLSALQ